MKHRSHVGPEIIFEQTGDYFFSILENLGLSENHKVLDVGCGGLRLGRRLISFLNEKNYTGVEPEVEILESAIKHELSHEIINQKKPIFYNNDDFCFDTLNYQDFIVCFDVFYHCGPDQLKSFLKNIKQISKFKTNIVISVQNSDKGFCQRFKGLYNYKHATHADVYYDAEEFKMIASKFNFGCSLINSEEHRFFGSRLIFLLKKRIKL